MEAHFQKKIIEIDAALASIDFSNEPIGLYFGIGGVMLYNAYSYKCTLDEKYADSFEKLLEISINKIEEKQFIDSFANGLAGFGWLLQYLETQNIFELDADSFLQQFDDYLVAKAEAFYEKNYLDFLHGAMGITFYFLNRWNYTKSEILKKNYEAILTTHLEQLKKKANVELNYYAYWESLIDTRNNIWGINLGLAHGIPGIVRILQLFVGFGFNNCGSEVVDLIAKANNFILSTKNRINSFSNYPSWIVENEKSKKSRLAWCYGDLTTVYPLFLSNDSNLMKEAMGTWECTLARNTLKLAVIDEACLCHGAFGLGHIYSRVYELTNNEKFDSASKFWFAEGFKLGKNKNGLAGFIVHGIEFNTWEGKYDLLNGIAGIGLVMRTVLSQRKPDWDSCLLLS